VALIVTFFGLYVSVLAPTFGWWLPPIRRKLAPEPVVPTTPEPSRPRGGFTNIKHLHVDGLTAIGSDVTMDQIDEANLKDISIINPPEPPTEPRK
jgi:hypothetical protein